MTEPYPVNLRLSGKAVLVVGGGRVAVRKVEGLLAAGADVTVLAPEVDLRLWDRAARLRENDAPASLTIEQRRYRAGDVAPYMLAITCTNDPAVNTAVHRDGLAGGVWVNSADDPENCEFTLPSVVRQGDLQLTISTNGRSPALAMWLRQRLEAEFDESWSDLLDLLSEVRSEARAVLGTSEISGWTDALEDGLRELVSAGSVDLARHRLRHHLGLVQNEDVQVALP